MLNKCVTVLVVFSSVRIFWAIERDISNMQLETALQATADGTAGLESLHMADARI